MEQKRVEYDFRATGRCSLSAMEAASVVLPDPDAPFTSKQTSSLLTNFVRVSWNQTQVNSAISSVKTV